MNEAQSTSTNLQILSKIKQVPSNYLWHSQHLGGRGFRDSEVGQGASCWVSKWPGPQRVLELLTGCEPSFRCHQLLPYFHYQQSGLWNYPVASSLPLWELLKAAWVTFWIHALIAKVLDPPHTVCLISTLPLFSCVYLTQHLWIWLFWSAAVW